MAIQYTPRLQGPYPQPADPAVVPSDLQAVVEWVEDMLAVGGGDPRAGWTAGDLKLSVRDDDHGRWLRCDGRELSQAQVEAALGLDAGEADAVVALLGTGGASAYGAAASGKIKLPDPRSSLAMVAGPAGDHPGGVSDRPLGQRAGVETVVLTARQSGLVGHTHVINDPGHIHTVTDPGHSHGVVDPGHYHAPGNPIQGEFWGGSTFGAAFTVPGGAGYNMVASSVTDLRFTGVSISSTSTGVTVVSHATGVTNQAVNDTAARDPHENMPPFTTLGHAFMRV